MASSDPQPLAERELAWWLHSAIAWTITGALMLVARRPLGDAVGVVLMALGLGLIGWVVQRRRHQPPRQLANWILRYRSARSGSEVPPAPWRAPCPCSSPTPPSGRPPQGTDRPDPAFGPPTPRDRPAFPVARRSHDPAQVDASLPQLIAALEDAERAPALLQCEISNLQQQTPPTVDQLGPEAAAILQEAGRAGERLVEQARRRAEIPLR